MVNWWYPDENFHFDLKEYDEIPDNLGDGDGVQNMVVTVAAAVAVVVVVEVEPRWWWRKDHGIVVRISGSEGGEGGWGGAASFYDGLMKLTLLYQWELSK